MTENIMAFLGMVEFPANFHCTSEERSVEFQVDIKTTLSDKQNYDLELQVTGYRLQATTRHECLRCSDWSCDGFLRAWPARCNSSYSGEDNFRVTIR